MKILQIFHKSPYPSIDGGCFAMKNILEGFVQQQHEVDLLIIETQKHPFNLDAFPEFIKENCSIYSVKLDTSISIIGALKGLLKNSSYHISRFHSVELETKLIEILSLNKYDIIHYESIFSTTVFDLAKQYSKAKQVIRTHNVEYLIWERLSNQENNKLKRAYLLKLAKQLKNFELTILNKADAIITITELDKTIFLNHLINKPKLTIPFGINLPEKSIPNISQKLKLYHLASMDWTPNIEAIEWFLTQVWDELEGVELHLAGKDMPSRFLENSSKNLYVQSEILHPNKYIEDKNILIVPLFSGSGIRVKVIEAMGMGKCVISTSIGLEGIHAEHMKNTLIANNATEFKEAVRYLKNNPEELIRIGENARDLIEKEYNMSNLSIKLTEFYEKLIK